VNVCDSMKMGRERIGTRALRALLLSGVLWVGAAMAGSDPALDQVDQAARTGHLDEAQRMMQSVLRDHPNSAKAHYVEAELLAQQNRRTEARDELAAADRLAPGLPFARPEALQSLRRALAAPARVANESGALNEGSAPAVPGSLPWGVLIAIAGGAIAAWALMRLGKPASAPAPSSFGGPSAAATLNPPWPGAGAGSEPVAGLGGQLARGLTTGLAVGAGMAAAEALGNRVLGRSGDAVHEPPSQRDAHSDPMPDGPHTRPDVAWRDFGIDDASTWDACSDADAVGGDWDA
jgi:hypothetical protein